jgi:hypothetical protein
MKKYENFWVVTIFRGVLAVLIGAAILVVPDMTRTLLLLPVGVAFAVISLAFYGVADSLLVFVTSFFASLRPARAALRVQSGIGITIGALFFSILFDRIQLHWFLYLIALQAFSAAFSEFLVARHTSRRHGSRWSYVGAGMALVCGVGYGITALVAPENLLPREIVFLAYAYLVAFGVSQTLMATRMIAIERRADRLAHAAASH